MSEPASGLLAEIRRRLRGRDFRGPVHRDGVASVSPGVRYPGASDEDLWIPELDAGTEDLGAVLIRRFVETARARGAEVVLADGGTSTTAAADWLADIGARKVCAWPELLRPHAAGERPVLFPAELLADGRRIAENPESADAGIVRADLGIALTGSVVLRNGESRDRLSSLLPPAAIFLLRARDIVPTLRTALAHLGVGGPLPSCVNIVTGPSSSADLEGDLFVGVHGPGRVLTIVEAGG